MPYSALEKKLRLVPESEFDLVSRFLDFILSGNSKAPTAKKASAKSPKKLYRQPGILKGKIWMAEDFDETPECFKEYMP